MNRDPKELLREILSVNDEVRILWEEYETLKETAGRLQGFDYAKPIVKATAGRGDVENIAIKLADEQRAIEERVNELIRLKRQVRALLNKLPAGLERNVMLERYILFKSWENVAADLGYSYRHVIRVHGDALEKLRIMSLNVT